MSDLHPMNEPWTPPGFTVEGDLTEEENMQIVEEVHEEYVEEDQSWEDDSQEAAEYPREAQSWDDE